MPWVALVVVAWSMALEMLRAQDEPDHPVCKMIHKNSLSFCSMVDYSAVLDEEDLDGSTADAAAKMFYDNMNVLLLRFGCNARYSLYTCDDCRDAYKYWICSVKFQKCGGQDGTLHGLCSSKANAVQKTTEPTSASSRTLTGGSSTTCDALTGCCNGAGRHKTCLSICEDVVRKCPYVLNFQCPTTETLYFSADIATCNKMDRITNPDRPEKPWPGTFA